MSRELECDKSEEQFERVFTKAVKPVGPSANQPQAGASHASRRKKLFPTRALTNPFFSRAALA
jgi:hypothetical protein